MTPKTVSLARPDPPLTDGVVVLRPFDGRDLPAIERSQGDAEILRWFGPSKQSPAEFLAHKQHGWEDGTSGSFAICDVAHPDTCLGQVFVEPGEEQRADIGYWLLREARGEGRATRAVTLASAWALQELAIARLTLWTHPENVDSQRLAERSGFKREGVLRSFVAGPGGRWDVVFFSLLPSDLEPTIRQSLLLLLAGYRNRDAPAVGRGFSCRSCSEGPWNPPGKSVKNSSSNAFVSLGRRSRHNSWTARYAFGSRTGLTPITIGLTAITPLGRRVLGPTSMNALGKPATVFFSLAWFSSAGMSSRPRTSSASRRRDGGSTLSLSDAALSNPPLLRAN